ncbi:glycoside hydrolase family 99-like domain-containing protein [Rhizobium sp. HT1-10]|uniref:glycoside hydrolase family 99-like domain-containing protein n=1 Tax=Rhizobium sp. HT1-10 TaxID=3111638 RepID=UPI003C1E9EEB
MKVLVGLIEHIGDIIACEPVSRYLRNAYPDAEISWAVSKPYSVLIDANPNIDNTIVLGCLTDWIKKTKHEDFDLIVDLHVNYRVCECCRIPLVKQHGNPLVNAHEWFDYGSILEAFSIGAGLPPMTVTPKMYIGADIEETVDGLGLPADYCVIHRESNNVDKDWDTEKWRQTVAWIQEKHGLAVVEIGASKAGARLPDLPGVIDLTNKTSLLGTAEVIKRAKLFIGVDSGPAHMANAVGTSGVVLLGRIGVFRKYNPFSGRFADGGRDVKILRNLTGRAREIPVEEMTEAVSYLLALASASAEKDPENVVPAVTVAAAEPAERELAIRSGLFDAAWYVLHNEQVGDNDPLDHFLSEGGRNRLSPSAEFDLLHYLSMNPDVEADGQNGLLHYMRAGKHEGRPKYTVYKPASDKFSSEAEPAWKLRTLTSAVGMTAPAVAPSSDVPRVFAFYLPQFHPIDQNDWAHGNGFTEWTNVIKAKPLFPGHYQPRLPGELGYYDLRSVDVMRAQVDLALSHGISGFCFYYYYFQGQKLLYKPIENYINSDMKAPFFYLWANENWSKRWDGGDKEVIIAQNHSPEDDIVFIQELVTTFRDERYVKVDGRPILMVYKAHLFADVNATTDRWRAEAVKHGFPGLYLVMVDDWSQDPLHPRAMGFDATYEIPSNTIPPNVLSDQIEAKDLPEDFTGHIVDYRKFASFHMGRSIPDYRRHKTVMAPWDNTPRYASRALVHINTENDSYRLWLTQTMLDTAKNSPPDERIVFLHSWNEWCEGTYIEPDGRNGRRYLEETKAAIDDVTEILELNPTGSAANAIATLRRIDREKDEGAFRVLQATKIHTRHISNELDRLRGVLSEERKMMRELESVRSSSSEIEAMKFAIEVGRTQPQDDDGIPRQSEVEAMRFAIEAERERSRAHEMDALRFALEAERLRSAELLRSISWRVTAPMRWVRRLVK